MHSCYKTDLCYRSRIKIT